MKVQGIKNELVNDRADDIASKNDGTLLDSDMIKESGSERGGENTVKSDDTESFEESPSEAPENGMELRKKRPRNYARWSPDIGPVSVSDRKVPVRTEKTMASTDNWLQCDVCHKWRLADSSVFDDLKRLPTFACRNLQGVSCKDSDDWAAIGLAGSEDASPVMSSNRKVKTARVLSRGGFVNIFAGRYVPGFGGEFSEDE
jgi:hypothetical protein